MVNALIDRSAEVNAPTTNPERQEAAALLLARMDRAELMRVLLAAVLGSTDQFTPLLVQMLHVWGHQSYVQAVKVLLDCKI